MKKLAVLLFFALSGSLFLASCNGGDDDNPSTPKPKPTVTWNTASGYKFQDGSEQAGNNISFGIVATPTSGEKITRVKISLSVNGGPEGILFDSTMNLTSYTRDWTDLPIGNLPGSKNKFIATVTQSNNESSAISFIITVTSPPRPTQLTANITLGAQSASTGSFFNPALGSGGVMTVTEAETNRANVHVVYYNGSTNKHTFASPSDASVPLVFNNVNNWSVRNNTVFKKTTLTQTDFENIDPNNSSKIDDECATGLSVTKVTNLAVGDVIAYRKQDGSHYALFLITAINGGASSNSTITFDMKNPTF